MTLKRRAEHVSSDRQMPCQRLKDLILSPGLVKCCDLGV